MSSWYREERCTLLETRAFRNTDIIKTLLPTVEYDQLLLLVGVGIQKHYVGVEIPGFDLSKTSFGLTFRLLTTGDRKLKYLPE